ncbi:hypothetical protein ACFQH9_12115 [Pseudonocardia lutea]|uniref:Short subunit dehydrogenase n=1 Tax=Pseudonocardia lutea TaxID=2172015 RepID=A0ABW1I5P7_9PSEU
MTATGVPVEERALAGQTVALIGGSAGIGLDTARRARAEGAAVVLTEKPAQYVAAVLGSINGSGS